MGLLDEAGLDRLVTAGCTSCGGNKLVFLTYVDGLLPLMGGEPVGKITWVYDGEKFVDGVYEVSCDSCKKILFQSSICPRCNAEEKLDDALESENRWTVPMSCPSCEGEEVRYIAFLPARVLYEGKRAEKARAQAELDDEGFHGYRVDCRSCGKVAERIDRCPLCETPAPLRARPG